MSRLLRKKQDKKLTHHTFLYKKHPSPSVGVKNFVLISALPWTKKIRVDPRDTWRKKSLA